MREILPNWSRNATFKRERYARSASGMREARAVYAECAWCFVYFSYSSSSCPFPSEGNRALLFIFTPTQFCVCFVLTWILA